MHKHSTTITQHDPQLFDRHSIKLDKITEVECFKLKTRHSCLTMMPIRCNRSMPALSRYVSSYMTSVTPALIRSRAQSTHGLTVTYIFLDLGNEKSDLISTFISTVILPFYDLQNHKNHCSLLFQHFFHAKA